MAEESDMTEDDWLDKARAFGHLYTSIYCPEDVTPYLHVFVYHIGFYLEKYLEVRRRGREGSERRRKRKRERMKGKEEKEMR